MTCHVVLCSDFGLNNLLVHTALLGYFQFTKNTHKMGRNAHPINTEVMNRFLDPEFGSF